MNKWTHHRGYIHDKDIVDSCFIFVKHNERSFEAVDLLTASNRSVWKKDQKKLFDRLSNPISLTDEVVKIIHGLTKRDQDFMDKRFQQNKLTKEVKLFLQEKLNVK